MFDIERIAKELSKNKPKAINKQKNSAVLIPLIYQDSSWQIVFQLRAKHMKAQPGEVSFPGGRREKGESFRQTALRETKEELNILDEHIEILADLNYLITRSGSKIYSYLGLISGLNVDKISPNPDEVDHLFTVPLKFFIDNPPRKYYLQAKHIKSNEFPYELIPNGKAYKFGALENRVYFYKYGAYSIWGYTAEILYDFIENMRKHI